MSVTQCVSGTDHNVSVYVCLTVCKCMKRLMNLSISANTIDLESAKETMIPSK